MQNIKRMMLSLVSMTPAYLSKRWDQLSDTSQQIESLQTSFLPTYLWIFSSLKWFPLSLRTKASKIMSLFYRNISMSAFLLIIQINLCISQVLFLFIVFTTICAQIVVCSSKSRRWVEYSLHFFPFQFWETLLLQLAKLLVFHIDHSDLPLRHT